MARRHLAALVMLTACAAPAGGNWIGEVTPRAPGPACVKTRGIATIKDDRATFIPNEGTWILLGTAHADGRVDAERIQDGANRQPFETRLEGRWTSTTLTGTYTTPRCVFDVTLRR